MGVVVTFLAGSTPQVKPEMGMPAMHRKRGTGGRRDRLAIAAQHIWPAMQQ
ncbi:hypothetical protein ACWTU9_05335 [Mesorhizobium sp. 128a]